MNELAALDKYLNEKKWRKAVKTADCILRQGSLSGTDSARKRFSFMSGDAYTYYTVAHPQEDVSWVKNHASVMFSKAYALSELKKYDEAVAVLEEVLKLDPVSAKTRFELCSDYIKLHKFSLAANELRNAVEYVMSLHDAAVLYQKGGFLSSQKNDFEYAKELTLYSLLFERREAAIKELRYIESMTGEFIDTDDESLDILSKQAAASLYTRNVAFTLSDCARTALEKLRALYIAGCDDERSEYYIGQLDGFDRVCNLQER